MDDAVGGGPAGSTAATLPVNENFSTLLQEREGFPRCRIGAPGLPCDHGLCERLVFLTVRGGDVFGGRRNRLRPALFFLLVHIQRARPLMTRPPGREALPGAASM